MKSNEPLVSIIIPSLNQGKFIEETIQSVLSQSYPSIEILVIDGGSNDCTIDILKKYNGLIKWISEKDNGLSDAVNKGFHLANGQIHGWINSDDVYFHKNTISTIVKAFRDFPEADIIYGDAVKISEESIILRMYLTLPYNENRMKRANYITQPTSFFRSEVTKSNLLENFLSLDYEYWLQLGEKKYKFIHIPIIIAGDRQYRNRISISRRPIIQAEISKHQEKYGNRTNNLAILKIFDRVLHSTCRLNGIFRILQMFLFHYQFDQYAFPVKIDSLGKLLFRQLFKNVREVF